MADTRSNPRALPPPAKRARAKPTPAAQVGKAKPVNPPTAQQQARLAKLVEKIDGVSMQGKTLASAATDNNNFPPSLKASMNVRLEMLGSAKADIDMLVRNPSAATNGFAIVCREGKHDCKSVDDQIEKFIAQNELLRES